MGICGSKKEKNIIDLFEPRNKSDDICIFSCTDEYTDIKSTQHTWMGIHYLIQSIPEIKNSDFTIECIVMYLLCIGRLSQCIACRDHWIIFIKTIYKYRRNVFDTPHKSACFLFDVHNFWNKLNHHHEFTWEQYKEMYNYKKEYIPVLKRISDDKVIVANAQKFPKCKKLGETHVTIIS